MNGGGETHLGGGHVLRVLLLARRRVENDVVYRLDELELHDAFNQQACKQLLVRNPCREAKRKELLSV